MGLRDMKTIEHEGIEYQAAENIWEMTIGPMQELLSLIKEPHEEDDLFYQMRMLSLISSIPLPVIEEMDYARFCQLASLVTFDTVDLATVFSPDDFKAPKGPHRFTVDGREYRLEPNYPYQRLKDAARMEDLLRGRELMTCLHQVLAIIAYVDGEEFDMDTINEKAERMKKAKCEDVFRQVLFFCAQGTGSLLFSRIFSAKDPAKASASTSSLPSLDGVV